MINNVQMLEKVLATAGNPHAKKVAKMMASILGHGWATRIPVGGENMIRDLEGPNGKEVAELSAQGIAALIACRLRAEGKSWVTQIEQNQAAAKKGLN